MRDLVKCLHGHSDLRFAGGALVECNAEEALILNFPFGVNEVRSFEGEARFDQAIRAG